MPPAIAQSGRWKREWEIGPRIRGRSYSPGMPPHPSVLGEGWYFDFPGPRRSDGHVHYVTRSTGPLDGARGILLDYTIEAAPGAEFVPQETRQGPATLSLYLQRRGDDWRARGRTRFYRWYSPANRVVQLRPGSNTLRIGFDENWISVLGSDHDRSPEEFLEALENAGRIGMTFGGDSGRGHGVYATGPARFIVKRFTVF